MSQVHFCFGDREIAYTCDEIADFAELIVFASGTLAGVRTKGDPWWEIQRRRWGDGLYQIDIKKRHSYDCCVPTAHSSSIALADYKPFAPNGPSERVQPGGRNYMSMPMFDM